jgi:hypothetical protein
VRMFFRDISANTNCLNDVPCSRHGRLMFESSGRARVLGIFSGIKYNQFAK